MPSEKQRDFDAFKEETLSLNQGICWKPIDDFCRGPKYLFIRWRRIIIYLRHWRPVHFTFKYLSDKEIRKAWETPALYTPPLIDIKFGRSRYRPYP